MLLINKNCSDSESFEYSILLYLHYYNIKNNHARVSQLNNNLNPYIHINLKKILIYYNLKKIILLLIYLLLMQIANLSF